MTRKPWGLGKVAGTAKRRCQGSSGFNNKVTLYTGFLELLRREGRSGPRQVRQVHLFILYIVPPGVAPEAAPELLFPSHQKFV
jgi:hypothetical protein